MSQPLGIISKPGRPPLRQRSDTASYKFLLKHYPIRSQEHGQLKILAQRRQRWAPEERARGWHVQYDHIDDSTSFVWDARALHAEGPNFWADYGYSIMTDALQTGLRNSSCPGLMPFPGH